MPQSDQRASDVQAAIKDFILTKFLPGEVPSNLTETTPLITGGVLDSISTIELVAFVEDRFEVKFAAYEVSEERLNTLALITQTVLAKLA